MARLGRCRMVAETRRRRNRGAEVPAGVKVEKMAPKSPLAVRWKHQGSCWTLAYIASIITSPKPEQLTWVAPSMRRAKS